jgi:hypothetical protein
MATFEVEVPDEVLIRFKQARAKHIAAIEAEPVDWAGAAAACDELADVYAGRLIVRADWDTARFMANAAYRAERSWRLSADTARGYATRRSGDVCNHG